MIETSHPSELLDSRPELPLAQINDRRRQWLHAALNEAYSYMKASKEAQQLPKEIAYLLGEQWDKRRPSYKASPVNNRLLRSMEQTVAILTDIRQVAEVKSNDKLYDDQADLLTKTIHSWWGTNDVDFQMAMATIYAYLGTGYIRIVWNPHLCDGMGDFEWQPCNMYEVLPIGPAHNFQEWEGCIYESVRTVSWFRRHFPVEGYRVRPSGALMRYVKPLNRPRQMGQVSFDQLSPQMQKWVGSPTESGEGVVAQAWYREFWIRDAQLNVSDAVVHMGSGNWAYDVKPGQMLYPRGRLIITGGDDLQVMYDGPNFFWHGQWPFIQLRLKPVPWSVWGLSELQSKIPLQDVVNTILAGTLDMVKKAINPPLLFPDNAFSDAVKRNLDPSMPNAKIGYSPMAVNPPAYGVPPMLPNYVPNMLAYVQNEMDDDSGLLDLAGMGRKKVTPAGDTLESLKESQQTLMRLRGRYIEIFVRNGGRQMVPNFFQFYTLARRMWMFGPGGVMFQDVFDANTRAMIPAGVEPQAHARIFSFNVVPGTLLKVNQAQDQLLAMALRRQGDLSRKGLYRMLDMEKQYDKVQKELDEEAMSMASAVQTAQPAHTLGKGSDNVGNLLKQG